jgi:2-polyprenyl-6-methoxyphenol hydroxylase-like FAD-dependent oxidoreductase
VSPVIWTPADHVQSSRGGGIGGLTLAAALRFMGNEQKLDVHIYESSSFIAEIGAGISFWPRSWRIMKEIGADDKLFGLLSEVPDDSTSKCVTFLVRIALEVYFRETV